MISKSPRVVIIVQARMGSTRLPGKIFKEVLGKSLLSYEIERLKRVDLAHELVVATSTENQDQVVENFCRKEGISVFRGSEDDVLSRYLGAARKYQAEVIVRITADCPLIDPTIVNQAIQEYLNSHPSVDYLSNTQERTYPRGMDVEVFSLRALEEAAEQAKLAEEREHVTMYLYQHPNTYRLGHLKKGDDSHHFRLTVDTIEDFRLIEKILKKLYPANPQFSLEDILQLLHNHPSLTLINQHIKQNN